MSRSRHLTHQQVFQGRLACKQHAAVTHAVLADATFALSEHLGTTFAPATASGRAMSLPKDRGGLVRADDFWSPDRSSLRGLGFLTLKVGAVLRKAVIKKDVAVRTVESIHGMNVPQGLQYVVQHVQQPRSFSMHSKEQEVVVEAVVVASCLQPLLLQRHG